MSNDLEWWSESLCRIELQIAREDATCRAFENSNKCGDCRKCWNKSIDNVSYLKH